MFARLVAPARLWLLPCLFGVLVLGLSWPSTAVAAPPAGCQFILGFKALHDLDPGDVGNCTDNQVFAANGDAQQHTANGLMAWRKADNWTAFTNGYTTWINGPDGLVHRLNTDRFPWEHDSASASGASGIQSWSQPAVVPSAIPLGDGKVGTTPQIGYVDSCTATFGSRGGASRDGPWVNSASGTWDSTAKVAVQGAVALPNASHSFTIQGSSRILQSNDLPQGSPTGSFPIAPADPAYNYDPNPNTISAQSFSWTVPATPTAASVPTCVSGGPIGIMTNGVALFDALDALGRDAAAHEVQDSCGGHPEKTGAYHYHALSPCLVPASTAPGSSTLVGYALDGYGIYLERDASGNLPTDADLDACHGRTSTVLWDGRLTTLYHYDVTLEYPYTLGCYHGTSFAHSRPAASGTSQGRPPASRESA